MIDFKTALYDQICHTAAFSMVLVGAYSFASLIGLNIKADFGPYNWMCYIMLITASIIVGACLRQRFSHLFYPHE